MFIFKYIEIYYIFIYTIHLAIAEPVLYPHFPPARLFSSKLPFKKFLLSEFVVFGRYAAFIWGKHKTTQPPTSLTTCVSLVYGNMRPAELYILKI